MTIPEMRHYVAQLYPGTWPYRVERMPDNQIMAIYLRAFSAEDSPNHNLIKNYRTKTHDSIEHERQLTIWDILKEKETGA